MSIGRQLADAFHVGALELHRHAERDRAHDRDLVRGVDAFDVEGRIGFGVAQFLRGLERGREVEPAVAHLREDVVRRAVDDARDVLDAVRRQPFAQRLDDRNAARHRRLERDHHALRARRLEDFAAMHGEQRLVRGDDVLAVRDGAQHQFARRARPADHLADDVDGRIVDDGVEVIGHRDACVRGGLGLRRRAHGDPRDFDAAAGAALDFFLVAAQYREGAAAHRAEAQQSNFDRFHAA